MGWGEGGEGAEKLLDDQELRKNDAVATPGAGEEEMPRVILTQRQIFIDRKSVV